MPPTFYNGIIKEKYKIAAATSLANYSFYIGVNNINADDALQANAVKDKVCGIKMFMGSSTGNLLVDNPEVPQRIFLRVKCSSPPNCEDEKIIRELRKSFIRRQRAQRLTTLSSAMRKPAINHRNMLWNWQKYNSDCIVLYISTEKELQLFSNEMPLKEKGFTAEVCASPSFYRRWL